MERLLEAGAHVALKTKMKVKDHVEIGRKDENLESRKVIVKHVCERYDYKGWN